MSLHNTFKKLLSFATGQAFNKSIFGAIAGGLASGIAGGLMGGGGSKGGGSNQALNNVSNNGLFNTGWVKEHRGNPGRATIGATGAMLGLQNGAVGDAGMFNEMARNNQSADMAGQLGQDMMANMGAWDPYQIAKMQYDQMMPILADDFDQANLKMEGRQFAQGRLGSTGGANDFNALFDSQGDTQRKLLADSFGQGLAGQAQNAQLAQSFMQLDPTLRGLFQGLGSNSLSNALSIQGAALDQFNASNVAAAGGNSGRGAGFNPMQDIGAGLMNSGVNQISGAFQGLFNPTPQTGNPWTGPTPVMNTPWGGV